MRVADHDPARALRGQLPPPDFLCARPEIGWRGERPDAALSAVEPDARTGGESKVVLCPVTPEGRIPAFVPDGARTGFPLRELVRSARGCFTFLLDWMQRYTGLTDRFAPPGSDAEVKRRVFLFIAFSLQGVAFGTLFALFYLAIGHPWGALTVLLCTAAMAVAPWVIRSAGLEGAGNLYALVLVAGFTALTAMEGGLYGHAVAWLAVVPLCACLLVGQQPAKVWGGVGLGLAGRDGAGLLGATANRAGNADGGRGRGGGGTNEGRGHVSRPLACDARRQSPPPLPCQYRAHRGLWFRPPWLRTYASPRLGS